MDIVILGGSGQLGKTLFSLLKENFKIISFTKSELSITEKTKVNAVIAKYAPAFVINCSAYTKVDLAEKENDLALEINFHGVKNLCHACKKSQSTLIHFSTDYVFDGKKQSPYVESDSTNPLNAYGASKLKGDQYIIEELENYFIFRVSGIFSEHGENFVKTMMRLSNKDTLSIINDQIMKPSSASFIANFINTNLKKNNFNALNSGLYNLTSMGSGISWYEFSKLIFREMLNQGLIEHIPKIKPIPSGEYKSNVNRPLFSVLSNDKLEKKFILPNSNYIDQVKVELKTIYKNL
ncbi:dTDP-4-dehydrorhamnose reductase [Gammaproteobacteria bacterium]|jgi:dTDP-4-dehydrorhamnose reductase|nr:dTDP-4-dehydrorhamnose reductase [Gammaproteobacteria bacterium]